MNMDKVVYGSEYVKDSYKVDKETKEREYLDYPSKMEFTLFYKGDSLQTTFFTWEGIKLDYVPDKGYPVNYELGPHSRVKFIACLVFTH